MNTGIRKAMPALIVLTLVGLGTPATAGPADDLVTTVNELYAQVYSSLPQAAKCPGPKTTTGTNQAFYWTVDGIRDPPGGEYLLASWSKTSHYGGSACGEVAFFCQVTVYALAARPMDVVNVTKTQFGIDVEGTYRGLRFDGSKGACGPGASFEGDISFPLNLLGFGHVKGQTA